MEQKIINGAELAKKVKDEVKHEIETNNLNVCLAVIIVGDNPASRVYVNSKKKDCQEVGIKSLEYALPENTTQEDLLNLVDKLNNDVNVNGILVQLPLPKHINENMVIEKISPLKDVDAFHAINVGKIMIGDYDFLPCTPAGCMELIKSTGVEISGKNAVVVGRSNIVGKPMAMLLLHENATVTICHSKTKNLPEICKTADILVAAVGIPNFINKNMVKEGAIVIDVGMNRLPDKKLCGDVDFNDVLDTVSRITPVPGGVGLMTRAILMKNTLTASKIQKNLKNYCI